MAKKKKHEEHENLERWLVSYADFMTLLFATFVVLYALAQTDVAKFSQLENSLKSAFDSVVMEGTQGVMDKSGSKVIGESQADSMMSSLILEYLNPKYEEQAFEEIKDQVKALSKTKELEGVDAKITDRGLVILMTDKSLLFGSGSAELSPQAKIKLDKIGGIIGRKFILHLIRVEGHTDNIPFSSSKYPSNWELSSARACSIVRYFIQRFKFMPELFTPVGFADTKPYMQNDTLGNRSMNRRVDIVILRNTYKGSEDARDSLIKLDKESQRRMKEQQTQTINSVLGLSDAAKELTEVGPAKEEKIIIIGDKKRH